MNVVREAIEQGAGQPLRNCALDDPKAHRLANPGLGPAVAIRAVVVVGEIVPREVDLSP